MCQIVAKLAAGFVMNFDKELFRRSWTNAWWVFWASCLTYRTMICTKIDNQDFFMLISGQLFIFHNLKHDTTDLNWFDFEPLFQSFSYVFQINTTWPRSSHLTRCSGCFWVRSWDCCTFAPPSWRCRKYDETHEDCRCSKTKDSN